MEAPYSLALTCSAFLKKQHRGLPATQTADAADPAAPDPQLMAACVLAMPYTTDATLSAEPNHVQHQTRHIVQPTIYTAALLSMLQADNNSVCVYCSIASAGQDAAEQAEHSII